MSEQRDGALDDLRFMIEQVSRSVAALSVEIAAIKRDVAAIKADVRADLRTTQGRLRAIEHYQVRCSQRWSIYRKGTRTQTTLSALISAVFAVLAGWFGSRN